MDENNATEQRNDARKQVSLNWAGLLEDGLMDQIQPPRYPRGNLPLQF